MKTKKHLQHQAFAWNFTSAVYPPPTGISLSRTNTLLHFFIVLLGFVTLINFNVQAQEEPKHDGLSTDCPGALSVPLSTNDWYDCPYPGDIMHCQGFVEIGSNLSPTNKLEVSHGQDEYPRQGISLNSIRTDGIRTSEIYFRYNNLEEWALGNDFTTEGLHNFFIWDHQNEITRLFFNGDRDNAFIGVNDNTNPIATLDVKGNIRSSLLSGATSTEIVQADGSGILGNVPITNFAADLNYWQSNGTDVSRNSGKVFIGMSPCTTSCTLAGYKLYVEGGIMARDIKVTAATTFPDFVFDKKYRLRSLPELEMYINENKHLPNIPSASEVTKNEGFEIGDMQTKLLQTLEEQTLYIIDLQKQMDELKKEVSTLIK